MDKTITLSPAEQAVLFALLRGAQADIVASQPFSTLYPEPTGLSDEEAAHICDCLAAALEG